MESICVGQIGHKPLLMNTVIKYWHFLTVVRAKLPALITVFNSYRQSGFCCCQCRTGYTYTSAHKCAEHGKEPSVITWYRALKFAFLVNAGKTIKHLFIRNNNIVKINNAIIYAIKAHFVPA